MGGVVCGLVQPPAPPQRDQICDAQQRHSGAAKAICQQREEVYETARQANPARWSRSTRCWLQPDEVWINKPPEEPDPVLALPLIQAA